MLQIRPGDLVAIQKNDLYVDIVVLTSKLLFGGHWCFVVHNARREISTAEVECSSGFNAFVDLIVPKRENRLSRIRRDVDPSSIWGPSLLQQPPLKGEKNYRIWQWKDGKREDVEYLRFTPSPSKEELNSPHYSTFAADFAWDLASRGWMPDQSPWIEVK